MRFHFLAILLVVIISPMSAQLVINEYVADNVYGVVDESGEANDWLEIYNAGSEVIDLSGYFLSDDKDSLTKWQFPAYELNAGEFLLIFASGKDLRIPALNYNTLIDWGDEWKYIVPQNEQEPGWRNQGFDDSGWNTGKSGFGYSDADDSTDLGTILSVFIRREFEITHLNQVKKLLLDIDYDDGFIAYINGIEVARINLPEGEVPYNQSTTVDHEAALYLGGSPERVEIGSPLEILVEGTNTIAIQGHNVSEASSDFTLIPFLSVGGTDSLPNAVSEHLSFPDGQLHTNFKINVDGESLYLTNAEMAIVDSVQATRLAPDLAYGRQPDGGADWMYFGVPTPAASNTTEATSEIVIDTVSFNHSGGEYSGSVSLSLDKSYAESTVWYTLDGSVPTNESQEYMNPLSITSTTVVRAVAITETGYAGPVVTQTYIINNDHQLPVVCLSTNPDNLWDEEIGIYVLGNEYEASEPYFGANFWEDWERPVHFELYDRNGIKQIDQGAGTKIFGNWSRAMDQKSMSLFARKKYGKGSFSYQIFDEKPLNKFESIVLRNSGNDNMGLQFQDGFITGLAGGMGVDKQAFAPAVLYLNGEYWGILNIREKVNEHFIAGNHNIEPEQVNLLEFDGQVIYGDNNDYNEIKSYLGVNTSLTDDSRYNWMEEHINIDNFIRYQLTQIYVNNQDWPGNNIKFWNLDASGSKFRWILFDTDFGFGIWEVNDFQVNTLEFALETNGPDWPNPPWSTLMFRRLVTNQAFRHNFINQYCDRINTNFTPEKVNHHLDSLQAIFEPEIQQHLNRWWGDYSRWLGEIENRKKFAQQRPSYARQHMKDVFGLGNPYYISLNVSDKSAGQIRINTVIPEDYPFQGVYFEDVPIQMEAIPRPGYKFVRWEGSMPSARPVIDFDMSEAGSFTAVFEPADLEDISIVINEINYRSADDRDAGDWVELYNNGSTSVNLEGWLLSDTGPDSGFVFEGERILAPGDFIVICRDLSDFKTQYPAIEDALGNMPFGLSGSGDIIRLYDSERNLIDAVDYYVSAPWPEGAQGTGNTIELKAPGLDNTRGENWQGITVMGTPGKINAGVVLSLPPIIMSEDIRLDCFPNPFRDFTTISFQVHQSGNYRIDILDLTGRVIETPVNEYLQEGNFYFDWYPSGNANLQGIYTVRVLTSELTETFKIIKLK